MWILTRTLPIFARTLRDHLLCKVTDGSDMISVELCARPHALANENEIASTTALLRQFDRPIDLVLAGAGRHAAAALHHAISNGFNALLLTSLDLSHCCITNKHVGTLCTAVRGCRMLERMSLEVCVSHMNES